MTASPVDQPARRVTVYMAHDGWRYRVQAKNWRIIEKSRDAVALKRTAVARARKAYPGIELVIDEG